MMWGGRFQQGPDALAFRFSSSFHFDYRLLGHELKVNYAHAEMLQEVGIIGKEELNALLSGLVLLEDEYVKGDKFPEAEFEDIHSFIEKKLFDKIGQVALKIHSGRSRNDLVVTSLMLWMRDNINELKNVIRDLQTELLMKAETHQQVVIPSYTHLQRAQPVSLAFHLMSHINKLERDIERLDFVLTQTDKCPLGSGAIAGSTLPLDRDSVRKKLGFGSVSENATDSINQRDFVLDLLHACSVGMLHLSSIAEEIILWSTKEWDFVKVSEEFTTGSSLMPQKKNPDIAELIRGKTGRVSGNYTSVTTTLKAMPFGYNRDLQEDKEALFDSFDTYYIALQLMAGMIKGMEFNDERFTEELKGDFSLSTDLADWLVMKNVPFRKAHEVVGKIVRSCEEKEQTFSHLKLDDLKAFDEIFDESALEVINIKGAIDRKKTSGSTNPGLVTEAISKWKQKLSLVID